MDLGIDCTSLDGLKVLAETSRCTPPRWDGVDGTSVFQPGGTSTPGGTWDFIHEMDTKENVHKKIYRSLKMIHWHTAQPLHVYLSIL